MQDMEYETESGSTPQPQPQPQVDVLDSDTDSLEVINDNVEADLEARLEIPPANGIKKRKLTSQVWNHFKILPKVPNQNLKCMCKKCKMVFSAESKHGTGNLHRHLKKCRKMTTQDIGQFLVCSDLGSLAIRRPGSSQERFRDLLMHAIIRHELPFSFVEYDGLKNLLTYLQPEIKLVSRNTAKSDIKKLHTTHVDRMKNQLGSCPGRICLTSYAWSSIVTDGYLSMTAHFIDEEWVLQKKILNFSYMPPPHNGVALSEKLLELATQWGIEKNLFSLTLDNASANDVCVNLLKDQLKLRGALVHDGSLFHVRCCAHNLNLIVQDGLKEIDCSVDRIRDCVKYVKGSQVRKVKFTHCVSQTSLDSKKALVQDVPTRWNSTYKMLSNALYYRLAFCQLKLSDSNFTSCPSDKEWDKVQKICKFLKIFYDATNAFSGSKYPTANLYFPQVWLIQLTLVEESNSPDDFMSRIASQMLVKFNKYWSEFNVLLAVAVVFDPRYKFQVLEFSYQKLYGAGSEELGKVRETLFALFDEYVNASVTRQTGASSSNSQNSSGSSSRKSSSSGIEFANNSIFKEFDEFNNFEFSTAAQRTELEMYLDEPKTGRTSNLNVLEYWKSLKFRFPILCKLARDVLSVPISTVASESAFSLGGRILDQFRSSLSPTIVEALVCTKDWLFGERECGADLKLEDLTRDIMALTIRDDVSDENVVEDTSSKVANNEEDSPWATC